MRFLNEKYVPDDKKIELTEEMLSENQLKRTMTLKFSVIFHPDKNVMEEKVIQVLRGEIMKLIVDYIEQFKGE